jgi:hypothetical protein
LWPLNVCLSTKLLLEKMWNLIVLSKLEEISLKLFSFLFVIKIFEIFSSCALISFKIVKFSKEKWKIFPVFVATRMFLLFKFWKSTIASLFLKENFRLNLKTSLFSLHSKG